MVGKVGAKRWSLIAKELPGRIGKQCRERCAAAPVVARRYTDACSEAVHAIRHAVGWNGIQHWL